MFGMVPMLPPGTHAVVPIGAGWPGASPELAAVLGTIVRLSASDQNNLARAFRAAQVARRPSTGLRLAHLPSFRGYDDFAPALTAARTLAKVAAAEAGDDRWYLNQDLCVKARIPGGWANAKGRNGRVIHGPRDLNFPRAQFWPNAMLPTGLEYEERSPIDPSGDVRITAANRLAKRAAFVAEYPEWAGPILGPDSSAPDFAMEHTPNVEMIVPQPEYA
jgi:hypothetical protein